MKMARPTPTGRALEYAYHQKHQLAGRIADKTSSPTIGESGHFFG